MDRYFLNAFLKIITYKNQTGKNPTKDLQDLQAEKL